MRELDGEVKAGLVFALRNASSPALVRSAFDLAATQRATLKQALNETCAADIELRFETAPELISGIELSSAGQKVAWSLADYLSSLKEGVDELLNGQEKSDAPDRPGGEEADAATKRP